MRFPSPLVPARLIRRYKRFLADAVLEQRGEEVTVHCPNPGAMTGLAEPGMRIWLEPNDDPRKKLRFGWRLVELPEGGMAGIDTAVPNKVVGAALQDGRIESLARYGSIRPEVPYGTRSRIDFFGRSHGHPDLYLEVKNVHLSRRPGLAEFPDCVTRRGTRHLHELASMAGAGHRAVMFYLVQRDDCARFALAADIDPAYAAAFGEARAAGVEIMAFSTRISRDAVELGDPVAIEV